MYRLYYGPVGAEEAEIGRAVGVSATLTALAFFALYVARLCPDLCLIGDSAELVTAAALWGVPHAPGYPLFTAVGHLFAAVPMHSVPWRVHLSSGVFHAGAVAATVVTVFTMTGNRLAAVAAGVALGISRSFLLSSLYAEVFPLNDFLFACLFALAMRVRRVGVPRTRGPLVALAVCAGLASANHMTIVLGAPALAILVARPVEEYVRASPRRSLELGAAFLLPLLLCYALIPLAASRSPWLSWGDVHDVRSLLRLATRQDYGGLLSPARHVSGDPAPVRVKEFCRLVVESMGVVTLAAAAWGAWCQLKRCRPVGASLVLAILLSGPAFAVVNAIDTSTQEGLAIFERFTTMCHVPAAIALGAGIDALRSTLGSSRVADAALAVVLLGWTASGIRRSADVDLSHLRSPAEFAHDLIARTPDGALVLLSGDEPAGAALYVCGVERACASRIVLSPGMLSLPWSMAEVRKRYPSLVIPWAGGPALARSHELIGALEGERPAFVYPDLLLKDPALAARFVVFPDGLLFRVWPRDTAAAEERAAFLASARSLAAPTVDGAVPSRRTAQEQPIARLYAAAFSNHAAFARRLAEGGASPDAKALDDLAARLESQAAAMTAASRGQGGDESMSR